MSFVIRPLETPEDMARLEALQDLIWPGSALDIVPAHLLLTLAHNGGLVLGAFEGGALVGFVLGFLGTDDSTPERPAMARLKHCSHQLGVHPEHRDRGLGEALKRAQRQHVLDQGLRLVTWTYDPLLSRNAYLNIRRLGAVCHTYRREIYGAMRDGLNAGVPADRFVVDWWVTSRRVRERLEGGRPPLDLAHFLAAGARELNPATLDEAGQPRPADRSESPEGALALVEIPPDFQALREHDAGLALAWRVHSRALFEGCFAAGYMVTDFVHLRGRPAPRSFYVLAQGEASLG